MLKKYFSKSSSGFTLIEALIAVNLIGISIYFGSTAITQLTKMKSNSQLYMNVNLAKRNLVSILQNNTAWVYTINGNGAEFDCLKNITGTISDPGCEVKSDPAGYPFIIYTDSNAVYYDPINNPTAGFDNKGDVCNTFDSVNGNPACPYRAWLKWRPHCDMTGGLKCHQPTIEIYGEIQIKKNTKVFTIQKSNYAFQLFRPFVNCPNQNISFLTTSNQWFENPSGSSGILNGTALSTTNPDTDPAMAFEYLTPIFACENFSLNFRQKINLTGPASVADAVNKSSVCLSDPNNSHQCLYEWRHAQASWSLWQYNFVSATMNKVYDMPVGPKPRFDSNTAFSFSVKKGMVMFYVDAELYWVFNASWFRNYSYKITPPPSNYSQGIEPF